MHRQGCLARQPALASQLLPPQLASRSRCAGVPRAALQRKGSSCCSSSIQQPSRCGSFPPLPVPTRQLRQQQQRRQRHVAAAAVEVWPSLKRRSRSKYVNKLNEEHGLPGFFEFYLSAASGQPVLYIMHPRGHTLEVNLQGANITRWLKPDGEDLLHMRSDADMEPGEPINSGIPLAFPQWRDGPLPFNGFADKMEWSVVGTEFDGQFVNDDVTPEEWESGDVELAVDDNADSLLPRPGGLIDESDIRGDYDPAAFEQRLNKWGAEEDKKAAAAATDKTKPPRGKHAKAARDKEEAESAAAAADAEPTQGAATAGLQAASDPVAAAAGAAAETPPPAAAAAGDQGLEDDEDEDMEGLGYGIIEDPAPFVILQLKDTAETRAIWPHKFELLYKITLMETDEFPDPHEGLPQGIFPYNGNDTPLGPEYGALRELMASDDQGIARAAAAELAECYRGSNIRNGIGADRLFSEAEAEELQPLPGRKTASGMRLFTDEDGQVPDEEAIEEEREYAEWEATAKPLRGAAASPKAKAKAKRQQEAAEKAAAEAKDQADADAAAEAAAAAAGGEGGDGGELGDLPLGYYQPVEEPMQVKMEWVLINKDPKGSEPMAFQLGVLPHYKTEDQMKQGEFVRVLGLGGSTYYDWSADTRRPRLVGMNDDYVTFDGDRHDAVYVNTSQADVKFCPGSRTHFELIAREGLPDTVVWHPGASGLPGLEVEPRFFAQLGQGRVALPKKLSPGERWKGEYVVRYHERYWDPPVFDRDAAQPMPKLVTQRDDADDREEVDDNHMVEGVVSSRLGGGGHVPFNDE